MKKVALILGPYDDSGDGSGHSYVMETGYLVDDRHVMYIDAEGDLWVEPVRRVDGRKTLYIPSDVGSGVKLATGVERGDIVISEVHARLVGMTGWAFLTNVLLPSDNAVELELLE
ncbi:hypothetical protein [Cohnella lupini]|uniref:Uncharacterized protein n=1 Tax=Cohnella lupini TaxID=1294267 RepID=A0A3D9I684_9BACL|nr:hypothetical protein [Cohnella lupini]RED57180.1 hypothetical protein DFP95_11194 [Cohnella lupini]